MEHLQAIMYEGFPWVDRRHGQRYARNVGQCIAILFAIICLSAIGADPGLEEPTYQGRSLSDWTREFDPHLAVLEGHEPAAWNAIGHIGTNAIPTLLGWMSEPDPPEPPKPHLPPCFNMSRSKRAEMALDILGETACPAIPQLTKLALTHPDSKRADSCIKVLACIGAASLPSFNTILTQGNPERRCDAMDWLPATQTNCVSLLPALIECLVGNNEDVGWKAASTIGRFGIPGSAIVSALTNSLATATTPARARVFSCLCWLKDPAREAVSAIRAGLSDPNGEVRTNAEYAAERIAPELLTNRELKEKGHQ